MKLIVAMDEYGLIGIDNELPWSSKEDMKHFKNTTMGGTVIMGRKTFESIGKPLPGRTNIVVTRDKNYKAEGATVVNSLPIVEDPGVFIIGGAEIYKAYMDHITEMYITRMQGDFKSHYPGKKNVYFPAYQHKVWKIKDEREIDGGIIKHLVKA